MKNLIKLVVGDWSHDGHNQTDSVQILSNLSKNSINRAYENGSYKIGFDFKNSICVEYEDNSLCKEKLNILLDHGLWPDDAESLKKDEEELYLDSDQFIDIYLFIAKLGDSGFKYKIINYEENPSINIGGYGLFFN